MIGAGFGGTSPPLLALLGDISPEDQVSKMGGVYNVFGDPGATLEPVVAFPVGAAIGYDLTYLLATTLVLVVGVSVVLTLLETDTETATQGPTDRRDNRRTSPGAKNDGERGSGESSLRSGRLTTEAISTAILRK